MAAETAFLAALDRLFGIGVLYPPDHAKCLEATAALFAQMHELQAGARLLRIDAGRDALAIQGRLVPLGERPAARLHEILTTIGVFRVEIAAETTTADLHTLASQLLRARHEADTAQGFRRLDFTGLPRTVRVHAREFGRRYGGADGLALRSDQVREAATQALQDLEGRGLDEQARETLRCLTEQFLQGVAERLEINSPTTSGSRPAFRRSLDEVLSLGIRAIRHALTWALPGGGEIGALRKLFESAEMALALSPDAQSVELMVDLLSEAANDADADDPATPGEIAQDDDCWLSLEELRRRLAAAATAEALPPWSPLDRAEQIAVLGQLLLRGPAPEALAGAGRRLEACLEDPLSPRESEILAGAVTALLDSADARVIDDALPRLLKPLRRSGAAATQLANACREASPAPLAAVWPHVVNELLLDAGSADVGARRELRRAAAALPEEEMRQHLPRLEALEAMRERVFSRQFFEAPELELWPLYSLLLGSTLGDLMGPGLLEVARGLPSAWAGAPALALLGDYAPRHRPFLARLLREVGTGTVSTDLLAAAGRVLVDGLRALPPDQRGAPSTAAAIRALAILPATGAGELLVEILHRRRLLLFKVWPAVCREAATHALRLRRNADALAELGPYGAPGER